MAKEVERGAKEEGVETKLKKASDREMEDLKWADGIIIGSPTYFGSPAQEIKAIIDESVKIRGELENKVGAAFSSSRHRAGGRETTMLSILQAMLVLGMVVCGDPLSSLVGTTVRHQMVRRMSKREKNAGSLGKELLCWRKN
jgi:NAD(P)H dehydrogenase (quinone)